MGTTFWLAVALCSMAVLAIALVLWLSAWIEGRPAGQRVSGPRGVAVGAALSAAVMIPAVAGVTYWMGPETPSANGQTATAPGEPADPGGPDDPSPESGQPTQDFATAPQSEEDFRAMAEELNARLQRDPDDAEAWAMLGRTLVYLEQYDQSAEAFGEAVERYGDQATPQLLAEYADALATAEGSLTGKPMDLVERALEQDPEHVQALWLAGTAAFRDADYAEAEAYWQRLLNILPPESEEAQIIQQNLAEVAMRAEGEAPQ